MPEVQKRSSTAAKRTKSRVSAKSKKPSTRAASTSGKGKKRSPSLIGTEGILIHTDDGLFYISEDEYRSHPLPDQGIGIAKVLIERGCLVASIPDDPTSVEGAYCYLISIANLKKTAG